MKLIPYTERIPCDTQTPITIYQKLVGDEVGILLESCEQPKGRYSFIATNPFAVLRFKGNGVTIEKDGRSLVQEGKVLEIARAFTKEYRVENNTSIPFVGGLVGVVGYDVIRQYEQLPDQNPDTLQFPDAHLLAIDELVAYDHFHHTAVIIVLAEDNEKGRYAAVHRLKEIQSKLEQPLPREAPDGKTTSAGPVIPDTQREEYVEKVQKAKEYIREGDIFQVVLSMRVSMDTQSPPFDLYRKLRQVNPSAYLFFFNFKEYQIAGSSPEMLVEVRKDSVHTCPIAGTRPRGANETEDSALAKDLLKDKKECAEHRMLVDLGRNDMGRIARFGSVRVREHMKVKFYSHVMHLVSLVEGKKRKDVDMFTILSSFLPAGTLSGAPKIRAMEIIEELENSKRGIYGGAAGYFGFDGDMDMCIAIRTMMIREGGVFLQAGAGIVADSVPEKEYEESCNKLKALIKAVKEV